MGNITIVNFEADILDRMDNTVMSQELADQVRQKLSGPVRLLRAMNQGFLLFCKNSGPKELQAIVDVVTLSVDPDIADTENLRTYLWPTTAFEERPDGGLMSVILDGQERLIREMTPLESVRMQAANAYYGASQRVFAYDLMQKRIYAPNALLAKARIITTPSSIYRLGRVVLSGVTDSGSTTFTITDGTTNIVLNTGALESASDLAGRLVTAINASAPFKASATNLSGGTFDLYAKSTVTAAFVITLSTTDAEIVYSPVTQTLNPGYYLELPISDVYTEALSLLALSELIKAASNPDNFGIVQQQTGDQPASQ